MEYKKFEIRKNGIPQEGFFDSIEACYKEAKDPHKNFYEFVGVAADHKRVIARYGQGKY